MRKYEINIFLNFSQVGLIMLRGYKKLVKLDNSPCCHFINVRLILTYLIPSIYHIHFLPLNIWWTMLHILHIHRAENMYSLTGRCLFAAQCGVEGCLPEEPCWGNQALKLGCPLFSSEDLLRHRHTIKYTEHSWNLHQVYAVDKWIWCACYLLLKKCFKQTSIHTSCTTLSYKP